MSRVSQVIASIREAAGDPLTEGQRGRITFTFAYPLWVLSAGGRPLRETSDPREAGVIEAALEQMLGTGQTTRQSYTLYLMNRPAARLMLPS
jgi:hypothetical protein